MCKATTHANWSRDRSSASIMGVARILRRRRRAAPSARSPSCATLRGPGRRKCRNRQALRPALERPGMSGIACHGAATRTSEPRERLLLLSPARPVFVAALLDLEADDGLRVDAEHGARPVLGQPTVERLALHEQPLGDAALHRQPAMLEALAARGSVGPGADAVAVRTPEEADAAAVDRLDRGLPEGHDHHAVGLAHAAPAGAR